MWTSANNNGKEMKCAVNAKDSCFSCVCLNSRCIYGYHSKVWNLQGIAVNAAWGKVNILNKLTSHVGQNINKSDLYHKWVYLLSQ